RARRGATASCAGRRSSRDLTARVEAALGPVGTGPATLPAGPRDRRVRVADRVVPAVVQPVVRQAALADVRTAVLVAPGCERVRLPQLVALVPAELRRVGARRRLIAADPGDPRVEVEQRAVERPDLRDREVEVRLRLPEAFLDPAALESLDRGVVALLDLA